MRVTAYRSSTPSWWLLSQLRVRGQRPMGPIYACEDSGRRALLRSRGLFAAELPRADECYIAAGLDVVLMGRKTDAAIELAQAIGAARPRFFATHWEGESWQTVIDPNPKP